MTDNQIIKALECCADEMGCKKGCPCFDPKAKGSCCTISKIGIEKIALDLINRQQADIRKLQLENEKLEIKLKGKIESSNKSRDSAMEVIKKQEAEIERFKELVTEKQNLIEQWQDKAREFIAKNQTVKSEAIKEFAERVKALDRLDVDVSYGYGREHYTEAIAVNLIDNLVKEIIGE